MENLNLIGINRDLIGALNIKPVAVDGSGAEAPENSEVRKIAEDILGAVKMSLTAVASNPDAPVRTNSLEADFKQGMGGMVETKRTGYAERSKTLIDASPATRAMIFGRAGERDFTSHLAIGGFGRFDEGLAPLAIDRKLLGLKVENSITVPSNILRSSPEGLLIPAGSMPGGVKNFTDSFESARNRADETGVVSGDKLEEIWGTTYDSDPFLGAVDNAEDDFEEFATTDKLGFWIRKIKCVDETGGWPELGHDEIGLAGITVDETGDTKKIPRKYIGGGFDDGDSKSYSNWRYTYFNMREGSVWPKGYSTSLILAEEDNNGLNSVLNDVWLKIRDKVKEAVEKAVEGGLTAYVGPAISKIIAKVASWILDALVGWIISWWKDDIFPAFTAHVTVPSMSARWHYPNGTWGNPSSGLRTAHFYGHRGHYYIQYFWKFYS